MSNEVQVINPQDMFQMATSVAKSGLFGMTTADQAMALMCVAQAEGRHPGTVARDYHIIQGRPALKADTMLARFQESGGKVNWRAYTEKECKGEFTHPSGGTIELSWTIDDARKAQLTGKDVWKKFPRAMLRARVISEAIRTIYPAVLCGFYAPEEVVNFDDEKNKPITTTCEVFEKWTEDELKVQDSWLAFFKRGGVSGERIYRKFGAENRGAMTLENWTKLLEIGGKIQHKEALIEDEFPTPQPEGDEPPELTKEEKRTKIDTFIAKCNDETEFEKVYKQIKDYFWFDKEADAIFHELFNKFLDAAASCPE